MRRAKAFFYVSLGVLALAVAFHLGARSAQGQGVSRLTTFVDVGNQLGRQWAGDSEGRLYLTHDQVQPWQLLHQFPDRVVGISPSGFYVVLGNGDVYWYRSSAGQWEVINNVFGEEPVGVESTTWGRIKADRR